MEATESAMASGADILSPTGLSFLPPKVKARGPGRGKTCWGSLMEKFHFSEIEGFRTKLDQLDVVEEYEVGFRRMGSADEHRLDPKHKALVSAVSGKLYDIKSDEYNVIQDHMVIKPLVDVCAQNDLKPIGRVDGIGTGATNITTFFADPRFKIQLLEDYDHPVMIGAMAGNNHGRNRSCYGKIVTVTCVCTNLGLHGDLFADFSLNHRWEYDEEELTEKFGGMLLNAIDTSEVLRDRAHAARMKNLRTDEAIDALYAFNSMPVTVIKDISNHMLDYAPQIEVLGLNALTTYDMLTAGLSHRGVSQVNLETVVKQADQASDLLTGNLDAIIQRGRERREKLEEEERERAANRKAKAPAIKVVLASDL